MQRYASALVYSVLHGYEMNTMVVVVEERTPLWAILLVIVILMAIVLGVLFFVITGGRGGLLVVAIPGYPPEAIMAGLALGVFLIAFKKRYSRERKESHE